MASYLDLFLIFCPTVSMILLLFRAELIHQKKYCNLRDVKKLWSILENVKPDVIIILAVPVNFNAGVLDRLLDVNVFCQAFLESTVL